MGSDAFQMAEAEEPPNKKQKVDADTTVEDSLFERLQVHLHIHAMHSCSYLILLLTAVLQWWECWRAYQMQDIHARRGTS